MLSTFETVTLIIGLVMNGIAFVFFEGSLLSTIYSIMCVINAIFNAQGKIVSRYFDILASIFYIVICLEQHLYASILTSIFVICISIYGVITWSKHKSEDNSVVEINEVNKKEILIVTIIQIILFYPYYLVFKAVNADSLLLTTFDFCLTFLAHFLLSKRSKWSFAGFLAKDLLLIIIWIPPLLQGDYSNASVVISMLYYLIMDSYGLYSWSKLQKQQNQYKGG